MIEGLKLRLTSKEIQDHCTGRAGYHRQRAAEKQSELPKVTEAMAAIKKGGVTCRKHPSHE